ncbi:hypothetical protein A2397_04910 [Candidatus Amesbacteria bacterium RIFOXYB1_FULL_44_23]|uniref:Uncharacterized protein n=1 Tax=Candidatus Amesbacteria bacterium RIFOXYB1_FULL_44_23 TaxID=1797263 RepID=A0A1F4ZQX9_9BACT|nr:MAG: hypothetical protein A2397_04910 [Candidatus Amesbacteria bacterium RIFOXYB1_FULL_44_23]
MARSKSRQFGLGKLVSVLALVVLTAGSVIMIDKKVALFSRAATTATINVSCASITISPAKKAYLPGEQVTLTVQGAGLVTGMEVYFAPAVMDMTKPYPADYWDPIPGSYSLASKKWTGTWTVPNKNGEYVIVPNLKQGDGGFCSGNPGYACANCNKGTAAGTINPGIQSCLGCQLKLLVNSNYSNQELRSGIDLKSYWNLNPGNSWTYIGYNTFTSTTANFNSRLSIEEKVNACGYTLTPLRFTKDSVYGYWNNKNTTDPGTANLRFLVSYFEPNTAWSENTFGALYSKVYSFPANSTLPISELGPINPTHNVNNRMYDTFPFSYFYYAPYLYAERYIQPNWNLERVDRLYSTKTGADPICPGNYNQATDYPRYWNIRYIEDNVDTPAYSGPVLRLRQIEGKYPLNTGWYIREDWYLAPNIGIVQMDIKNLVSLCPNTGVRDPDCDGLGPMANPPAKMKLTGYYRGDKGLSVSVTPETVSKTGKYYLRAYYVENGKNIGYTGYLQAKSCIGSSCTPGTPFKWGNGDGTYIWMNNGVGVADLSKIRTLLTGEYHSYFRPFIDVTPADTTGETTLTSTNLPWSNQVVINVTP